MIDMALEENLESKSEFTFIVMVSIFLNEVSLYESFGHGRQGQMIRWKLAIYTKGPFTVSFYLYIIHVLYSH